MFLLRHGERDFKLLAAALFDAVAQGGWAPPDTRAVSNRTWVVPEQLVSQLRLSPPPQL